MPLKKLRRLRSAVLGLAAFVIVTASSIVHADQFANPLDVLIADPHVLRDGSTYYLYGTGGNNRFRVWSSEDLVNWQYRGVAFQATAANWGKNRFWAPEVLKRGSTYYLVYSAGGSPNDVMRICIATATSPLGPFTDLAAPLFDDDQSYIDGHIFIDTDNTPYLFASQDMSYPADNKSETVVAQLTPNLTALTSSPTLCITPSASWEITAGNNQWNEAGTVLLRNGTYYLLYSGNVYSSSNYAIGYATATHPLGPWTKYAGNPVLKKTSTVSGPGHCSLTTSPDGAETWLVYHTHQSLAAGNMRHLAIDRVAFTPQPSGPDVLSVPGGPSLSLRASPSGAPPFPVGGSDPFDGTELNRGRWTVFSETPANFTVAGGSLNLTLEKGDTNTLSSDMNNIFLQYPPSPDFRMTLRVDGTPQVPGEIDFLTVWQDHNNYIRFADLWSSGSAFEFATETNSTYAGGGYFPHSLGGQKTLRIDKVGITYRCYARNDSTDWTPIGPAKVLNFSDIKVGFGGSSLTAPAGRLIKFEEFTITDPHTSANDWSLYQ